MLGFPFKMLNIRTSPPRPDRLWGPSSLPMGTRGFFPEGKAAGAWNSPPSSAEVKEYVELYLHSPIRLHGVVLS